MEFVIGKSVFWFDSNVSLEKFFGGKWLKISQKQKNNHILLLSSVKQYKQEVRYSVTALFGIYN